MQRRRPPAGARRPPAGRRRRPGGPAGSGRQRRCSGAPRPLQQGTSREVVGGGGVGREGWMRGGNSSHSRRTCNGQLRQSQSRMARGRVWPPAPAMPASSAMPAALAWLECSSSRPPRSLARTKHCCATSSWPLASASSPSWRHLDSLSAQRDRQASSIPRSAGAAQGLEHMHSAPAGQSCCAAPVNRQLAAAHTLPNTCKPNAALQHPPDCPASSSAMSSMPRLTASSNR